MQNRMANARAVALAKKMLKKQQIEALSQRSKKNYTAPKRPRCKITSDTQSDPIIVGDAPMPDAAPKRRTTRVTGQRYARDFFTVNSFDDSTYKRVRKTPLAPPRPVDARSSYGHGFWDEEFLVEQLLAMIRKPCAEPDCHSRVHIPTRDVRRGLGGCLVFTCGKCHTERELHRGRQIAPAGGGAGARLEENNLRGVSALKPIGNLNATANKLLLGLNILPLCGKLGTQARRVSRPRLSALRSQTTPQTLRRKKTRRS